MPRQSEKFSIFTMQTYGMARPSSLCRDRLAGQPEVKGARQMSIAVLGIDLGKNSCSVVGLDESGAVVKRRRMHRDSIAVFAKALPACVVAMEACCGAHHLGRSLMAQGHDVRLMSPEYVRPYVKAQKNDDRDAEAIAEAATRPTMRFVELKSEEQLDAQTLHRARDRLVGERTALINQLRAILLERGIVVPQGRGVSSKWGDQAAIANCGPWLEAAQRGSRIPIRARRCGPRSGPAAAGLHLLGTIASAAICSSAD